MHVSPRRTRPPAPTRLLATIVIVSISLVGPDLLARPPQDSRRVSAPPLFRDVTAAAGIQATHVNGASPDKYLPEIMGSGGLFFDADADGWVDIFLVDGGSLVDARVSARARHRLYRNRGNGTFEDVTEASGIRHREYGMGACAGDIDNDGAVDLYITNYGPNILYRNTGGGHFVEAPRAGGADTALWSTSCAFLDVDRDGLLDLFVTNYVNVDRVGNRFCGRTKPRMRMYCHPNVYDPLPNVLYRNSGGGGFEDISRRAGISRYLGNGLGVATADVDDDGWADVFVANDGTPNFLFRNTGKGTFEETALPAGVAVAIDGTPRAGMGTTFGDYDGDGHLDLVVTNHESEMHSLFRRLDTGLYTDATLESGLGPATLRSVGFGVAFIDFDNDMQRDLAIAAGNVIDNIAKLVPGARHAQPNLLLRNTAGRFTDVSEAAGPAFVTPAVSRTLVWGDIDNDGYPDLLVTNNGGDAQLLRNSGGYGHAALLVDVIGARSNRDAIGARVRVTAAGHTLMRQVTSGSSYLGQNDHRLHFGLGRASRVDRLEVAWPDGTVDRARNVPVNHVITVREGAGEVRRVPFASGRR